MWSACAKVSLRGFCKPAEVPTAKSAGVFLQRNGPLGSLTPFGRDPHCETCAVLQKTQVSPVLQTWYNPTHHLSKRERERDRKTEAVSVTQPHIIISSCSRYFDVSCWCCSYALASNANSRVASSIPKIVSLMRYCNLNINTIENVRCQVWSYCF